MTSRRFLLCAIAILSCLCVSAQRFEFYYEGVGFKAKMKNSAVCVTSFDVDAEIVVIPSIVNYKGIEYPVKEVDLFVNGCNYMTRTLVLSEGIEIIDKYAFDGFRKLESVTLPSTIKSIGGKAFRGDNPNLVFNLPEGIEEQALRTGKSYKQSTNKNGPAFGLLGTIAKLGVASKKGKDALVGHKVSMPVDKKQANSESLTKKDEAEANAFVPNSQIKQNKNVVADVDVNIPVSKTHNTNTYCIIIANEKYEEVPNVEFANNDGMIFKEYCIKTLGIPEEQVRIYTDAGYTEIRKAITFLKRIQTFDKQAKLILYYAGHGIPNEQGSSAYIMPVDAIPTDMTTCISLNSLYKELGKIKAQSVIVLLDACFSGMARNSEKVPVHAARMVALKVKDELLTGNVLVMSAASGDETALPLRDKQHGLFTYYLLNSLKQSKGKIKMGDLYDDVSKNVLKNSVLKNDKVQHPAINVSASMRQKWRTLDF